MDQKNVSLRGGGVDLPECQERRRGKHKGTEKSVFFFGGKGEGGDQLSGGEGGGERGSNRMVTYTH